MVASKLTKYLDEKDKNNVKVSSWALTTSLPGIAKCKHCDCTVKFGKGKAMLISHSETEKHKKNIPKDSTKIQMDIAECLSHSNAIEKEEQKLKRQAEEFEISLARSFSNHKVPMQFIECLQSQLKKYCVDSKVVDKMSISRRKAETIVRHGVGPGYQQETIKLMQEADCFSIGFDESEVNKISELEVLTNVCTKDGIELRHYRTIDLPSGTATTIVKTLLAQFDEDGIDYRKKLFSCMTDGCNTMQGQNAGVKKLLSKEIPQYIDLGSCNDHHLSNALKHAVTEFDPDIQQALVNIYMDIGGAKGKGLKKKKEFERVCESIGLIPHKFKKFSSTRFRGIRNCIKPVLHNWDGIIKYYQGLKKPTERQTQLKAYFVDREWMSLLNMTFVMSGSRELNEAIDYFEQRTTLIHLIREKMEQILRSHILKFMNDTSVKKLADDETVEAKTGRELLSIDVDDKERILSRRRVFVGVETNDLIKSFELEPKSKQLDAFYENVYRYHRTVALRLMKYFDTGLKCTELRYISALAPNKYNAVSTSFYLKYLVGKFSKIIDNIDPSDGVDKVKEEIDTYTMDDEIQFFSNETFDVFWSKVSQLQDGVWQKYPILPRFVLALSTAFNSNSEAERAFSVQTDLHRNPKRNSMLQETFDAHMQVHYGVESKGSRDICELCIKHQNSSTEDKPREHCHCSVAPIDDAMKEQCRGKWSAEKGRQKLKAAKIAESEDPQKIESTKEEAKSRKIKFISGLKSRKTFYKSELMTRVYKPVDEKKKDTQASNEAVVSPASAKSNTCDKEIPPLKGHDLSGLKRKTTAGTELKQPKKIKLMAGAIAKASSEAVVSSASAKSNTCNKGKSPTLKGQCKYGSRKVTGDNEQSNAKQPKKVIKLMAGAITL